MKKTHESCNDKAVWMDRPTGSCYQRFASSMCGSAILGGVSRIERFTSSTRRKGASEKEVQQKFEKRKNRSPRNAFKLPKASSSRWPLLLFSRRFVSSSLQTFRLLPFGV